ncbi:hypothetical protein BOO71_0003382 [Deinococcus marmoris]|uniref:Uncharacterized protein n=1 Tax=Deinococcus marmoris TaxID=249408 RepID=A0A1U7P292_9DEIO|nr:hypothetical protein BOO71_0003382 [Deinococcus marmoris]
MEWIHGGSIENDGGVGQRGQPLVLRDVRLLEGGGPTLQGDRGK